MVNANELLTPTAAANWKTFVADYLVMMTSKKANRAFVADYSVRRTAAGYVIRFGALAPYPVMTAEKLYDWAQRLPLRYFADEADTLRADLLGA
jgi:hypothetical protein